MSDVLLVAVEPMFVDSTADKVSGNRDTAAWFFMTDIFPEGRDLQERIAHLDVNKIGLVTINRLRSYISDTRFIPEKL